MTVEDLREVGVARMDDAEMRTLLSRQGVGVLGLVSVDGPYLLPLSFGFEGESALYFTYLTGTLSRKRSLSESRGGRRFWSTRPRRRSSGRASS